MLKYCESRSKTIDGGQATGRNRNEAIYNLARFFHHVGSIPKAEELYNQVIKSADSDCDIRKRAIFNLSQILKGSGYAPPIATTVEGFVSDNIKTKQTAKNDKSKTNSLWKAH